MILCEWDTPEGHPGSVAYTFMLSYPIEVFTSVIVSFSAVTLVYLSQWYVPCLYRIEKGRYNQRVARPANITGRLRK
jgi:hypothetical protein